MDLFPNIPMRYTTLRAFSAQLGVSRELLNAWCARLGIETKRGSSRRQRLLTEEDCAKLKYVHFMRTRKLVTIAGIALDVSLNGWPDPKRVATIIDNHHKELITKFKQGL